MLFENVVNNSIPVLANLFGTTKRVAIAMGKNDLSGLRELGQLLAQLKQPEPPAGIKDTIEKLPVLKKALSMPVKTLSQGKCQENVIEGDQVDLSTLPIQTCWPKDVAPLITWGLVITKGPYKKRTKSWDLSTTVTWQKQAYYEVALSKRRST